MFGTVSDQLEVKVPASEAWKVYGTLKLIAIIREKLSNVVQNVEVVEGDGGPGTKVKATFRPGFPFTSYIEKFVSVDDEKRVKVVEIFEGGYLDLGFTLFRVTFEVIPNPNDESSCTTKATLEYELKDEFAANAPLASIDIYSAILKAAAEYLLNSSTTNKTGCN